MSILTTIALAAAGIFIPGAGVAIAIYKFGKDAVLGALKAAAKYLFLHPMTAVVLAGAIVIFIQAHKLGNRDDTIAGQGKVIAAVKAEVDRGVGKTTKPEDAPFYIRHFVDNVRTLDGALTRQTTALNAAKTDANAHDDDAHKQGQPTADEAARDRIRKQLQDPARVDGADTDWGKL